MSEQSSLYKFGSGIAQDVDIISDESRQLGQTDIGSVGSAVTIETDGEPRLGEVKVHNTVDTDISRALQSSDPDDPLEVIGNFTIEEAVEIANQVDTDISAALNAANNLEVEVVEKVVVEDPQHSNHDSVTTFTHDASADMPNHDVPDGVKVDLQADPENAETVYVGERALPAGEDYELAVTNTNIIETSGTGQINVIFEG